MYIEGKACWLNDLDTAMEKYNNRAWNYQDDTV